ncbi:aspartate aminotransferase family protein [Phytopseudomonas dryadis]|uniref:Aspartate aminotransferase family protein n=1 Tax=Phytopseudomonas dryadis TaxID=2487520 RepID=A0A4Q9QV48_9GAMM|nr:aminotransferase class III-fold pyridoxal phosphate-dependent enzyme [Pseudomonas dryadis]TBU87533.1 aspartate aminotransferase family protein [Pseudomonas dryadis]
MHHLVGGISSAGRALPALDGIPFLAQRAAAHQVWDTNGRAYIDTAMGFGAAKLGHADPDVLDAVTEALRRAPMPSYAHALEEQAASALASCTGALDQVIFVNTGSEAVHLACRAARAYTGRKLVAKFAAGYDGWYDPVAFGNAASADAGMPGARPVKDGMTLLRYNDFDDIERLFAQHPDIAAVLLEPMLANAGCVVPAPGYLERLCKSAHAHGALVILDEVLMGFQVRAGLFSQAFAVDADLACVGKAIGSGIPVAAVLGTAEVMREFETGNVVRAGTYSGNPPACAAVLATLGKLKRFDYAAHQADGNWLRQALEQVFARNGLALSTSGYGSVFSCWHAPRAPRDYSEASAWLKPQRSLDLHLALRRRGLLTMPAGYGRIYLSVTHTRAVLEQMLEIFGEVADAWA